MTSPPEGPFRHRASNGITPGGWLLHASPAPARVAILRALALGDLLCAVPAFRALRAALPGAKVTLIGLAWARSFARRFSGYLDDFLELPGYPGLPESQPRVDEFPRFLVEAQGRGLDLAIQLHGSGSHVNSITALLGSRKTAGFFVRGEYCPDPETFLEYADSGHEIHRQLALTNFLGAPEERAELEWPILPADLDDFDSIESAGGLAPGTYACVHPGSRFPSRRWPARRFARLGDALHERGLEVVLTGSLGERELTRSVQSLMSAPALDLAGRTSLGAFGVLLSRARLVVTNDTGSSHLAAALRTPSVVIFSASDPNRWAPLDRSLHRIVIHGPVECRPCVHEECPIGHPCSEGVTVEAALQEVDGLLAKDMKTCIPCAY